MDRKKHHELIDTLGLKPHPEGGFFKRVYQSESTVQSHSHSLIRPSLTHIYFLLLRGQVSRFHRVLHDEIWNHYEGAPLRLYTLGNDTIKEQQLGGRDTCYAAVVPAGCYQGGESTGDYTLVGCSVAPGFDFDDFSFIEEPEIAQWVKANHPEMARFL